MTAEPVFAAAQAGMSVACPRCEAQPGEFCVDRRHGSARLSTHQERKDVACPG